MMGILQKKVHDLFLINGLNCLKNPNILTLLCKDSKKLTPHKMNPMK